MTIWRVAAVVLIFLSVAACGQSMTDQPRYDTYAPASAFSDGSSARMPPEGTVRQSSEAYRQAETTPPKVTPALVERGHQRFDIYCAPCHGLSGYGDGIIVKRGFPPPPSYHSARLRDAPASHFYDVITNGYGVMYSYAARVSPRDRWAIIAYIRALQLSQHATTEVAQQTGVKLP